MSEQEEVPPLRHHRIYRYQLLVAQGLSDYHLRQELCPTFPGPCECGDPDLHLAG